MVQVMRRTDLLGRCLLVSCPRVRSAATSLAVVMVKLLLAHHLQKQGAV